ncbi:MAG: hypothetical protein IJS47_01015 [Clostridia bacterium]|nr:hypothetical protein [Clostridia bacterium]
MKKIFTKKVYLIIAALLLVAAISVASTKPEEPMTNDVSEAYSNTTLEDFNV